MMNNVKTALLLGSLTGIILLIGSFWGSQGLITRTREYAADASGAEVAGTPTGLASALQKLDNFSKRLPMEASPNTAHMFIVHPFSGSSLLNLFSTHPPIEKRIQRLMNHRG